MTVGDAHRGGIAPRQVDARIEHGVGRIASRVVDGRRRVSSWALRQYAASTLDINRIGRPVVVGNELRWRLPGRLGHLSVEQTSPTEVSYHPSLVPALDVLVLRLVERDLARVAGEWPG